jgi:phosphoribosylglycinamide formyltransferase-1
VDGGPIIEQRIVEVRDDDTAESLAARVFEEEKRALPAAIALHLDGKLVIRGLRVVRRP